LDDQALPTFQGFYKNSLRRHSNLMRKTTPWLFTKTAPNAGRAPLINKAKVDDEKEPILKPWLHEQFIACNLLQGC